MLTRGGGVVVVVTAGDVQVIGATAPVVVDFERLRAADNPGFAAWTLRRQVLELVDQQREVLVRGQLMDVAESLARFARDADRRRYEEQRNVSRPPVVVAAA